MSDLPLVSSLTLFLAALCALLAWLTPADSSYETVELESVSTRKVFVVLAVVFFSAWVALKFL